MVVDYFWAEVAKLTRRPASWILSSVLIFSLVLLGYLFTYVFVVSAQAGNAPPEVDPDRILSPLLPENVLGNVLAGLPQIGAAIALVFGALAAGGEYGWGTLKLIFSQRPGRLEVLFGKTLAVAAALAVLSIMMILVGSLCSAVIAGLQDEAAEWPSVFEMLKGAGAAWLILTAWASLGFFFGILFRGASLAIGVGLAYALAVEGLALRLPIQGDTFASVKNAFIGKNASDLVASFGDKAQRASGAVEPTQAVLVLATYTAVFLVGSALLFRRRDV